MMSKTSKTDRASREYRAVMCVVRRETKHDIFVIYHRIASKSIGILVYHIESHFVQSLERFVYVYTVNIITWPLCKTTRKYEKSESIFFASYIIFIWNHILVASWPFSSVMIHVRFTDLYVFVWPSFSVPPRFGHFRSVVLPPVGMRKTKWA